MKKPRRDIQNKLEFYRAIVIEFEFEGADYRYAESSQNACVTALFDSNWLDTQGQIHRQISSHGRATVTLFHHREQDYVLKHYHRGGFVRRFSKELYLWRGLQATRAWREYLMLSAMHDQGLPCPKPYACRVQRQGLFYQASLITELIPNSQTLAQRLSKTGLGDAQWRAVGECVKRFHDAHFCHADLNADNIMITQQDQIFLIDFDKSLRKKPARAWQFANLKRLQRSLMKYWMEADTFCFGPADWESLRQGYLDTQSSLKNGDNASK